MLLLPYIVYKRYFIGTEILNKSTGKITSKNKTFSRYFLGSSFHHHFNYHHIKILVTLH